MICLPSRYLSSTVGTKYVDGGQLQTVWLGLWGIAVVLKVEAYHSERIAV